MIPHGPLALAVGLLGLLAVVLAAERALSPSMAPAVVEHLESRLNPMHAGPVLELALGAALATIALGLALRSRLAWVLALAAIGIMLSRRVPPTWAELPLVLVEVGLAIGLIVYRGHFQERSTASAGLFATAMLGSYLLWASLGTLRLGADFEPAVEDLPTAFYFTAVTVSSVGYGDILPRTIEARMFVTLMIALGVVVAAISIGAVLVPLIEGRLSEVLRGRRHVDRRQHFVVIGSSPLARNTIVELEKRHLQVTVVLGKTSDEEFFKERDVVVGDPTDLDVLTSAGAKQARAVLALSSDDAENGFVVLGMHELNESVPTAVALNDLANEHRIKRTQPSLTLSVQALGGRLLAMALAGEELKVDMLRDALQIHEADSPAGGSSGT